MQREYFSFHPSVNPANSSDSYSWECSINLHIANISESHTLQKLISRYCLFPLFITGVKWCRIRVGSEGVIALATDQEAIDPAGRGDGG